jgi:hypothetical protein
MNRVGVFKLFSLIDAAENEKGLRRSFQRPFKKRRSNLATFYLIPGLREWPQVFY